VEKLAVYNFTIFDATMKEGFCYVWDQTVGKRGSDEINSCVLDFIEQKVKKGMKELHSYSDNCSGQNKNQFLFSMLCMAAEKFGIKIIHRWLEKGHTQMECDSMHGRIEIKVKRVDIFTPSQWYGHIRTAKVNKPLYQVKELNQQTIFSFRELAKHFRWSAVPVKSLKELIVDCANPGFVTYRTKLDGPGTTVGVLAKKSGRPLVLKNYRLKPAYCARLPLRAKLLQDLRWYVEKGHIPDSAKPAYESLPNWSSDGNHRLPQTAPALVEEEVDALSDSCSSCVSVADNDIE
jgi:hypothetical protein